MKTSHFQIIALLVASAGLTAPFSRPVCAQTTVAAPAPVTKPSLEVQISSSVRDGKNYLALDSEHPHLNVTLRNVSGEAIQLFSESCGGGFYNLHLEIIAVDGKTLTTPRLIEKGEKTWISDWESLQTMIPNQALVREVYFHVPANIRHPETPATPEEMTNDLNAEGDYYWFFPFPKKFLTSTVTMKAVFEVEPDIRPTPSHWQGRIESAPVTYEIRWGAPRR